MPQTTSFGGVEKTITSYTQQSTKKIADTIKDGMPSAIKIMDKLRCLKGEAGGIIINALGTGLVAPIFIAFNPLSKADEKTKKYTAMRQPVSAVLAILIQAGLTKPLDMFYNYMSNNGILGNSPYFDKSNLKDRAYFIKECKKLGITGAQAQAYADSKVKEQAIQIIKALEEEGTIKFNANKQLQQDDVIHLMNKTLESYKTEIKELIEKNSAKEITQKVERAKLLINPNNEFKIKSMCNDLNSITREEDVSKVLDIWLKDDNADIVKLAQEFKDRATLPAIKHRVEGTLKKMTLYNNAVESCDAICDNAENLKKILSDIVNNKSNNIESAIKQIREISTEKDKNSLFQAIANSLSARVNDADKKEYAQKIIARINEIKNCNGDKFKLIELYQKAYYKDMGDNLLNQLKIIDSLKINPKSATQTAKELIQSLKTKVFNFNQKNFSEDMFKTWEKTVGGRVKAFKQITNILFGLFITLPVTCTTLNWVYPRFMDIFFPNLARNDKCEAPEEKAKIKARGGK